MRARIPRSKDPLGFGLRSIPVPLHSLWLIRQGNSYFEEDVKNSRKRLGIPVSGFLESNQRVDLLAMGYHLGWATDVPVMDDGSSMRHWEPAPKGITARNVIGREMVEDPLVAKARLLARMYGIEQAELEPGFEFVIYDVAAYLLKPSWPPRQSICRR